MRCCVPHGCQAIWLQVSLNVCHEAHTVCTRRPYFRLHWFRSGGHDLHPNLKLHQITSRRSSSPVKPCRHAAVAVHTAGVDPGPRFPSDLAKLHALLLRHCSINTICRRHGLRR